MLVQSASNGDIVANSDEFATPPAIDDDIVAYLNDSTSL